MESPQVVFSRAAVHAANHVTCGACWWPSGPATNSAVFGAKRVLETGRRLIRVSPYCQNTRIVSVFRIGRKAAVSVSAGGCDPQSTHNRPITDPYPAVSTPAVSRIPVSVLDEPYQPSATNTNMAHSIVLSQQSPYCSAPHQGLRLPRPAFHNEC